MVHSLLHPHNSFPGDNPSHTHLTWPNCTYLGEAHKDQEFSGPSHGHVEAAVCFGKMQSSVVPANQTSFPKGLGLSFGLELVGLHTTNASQQGHGRNAEKPAALLRAEGAPGFVPAKGKVCVELAAAFRVPLCLVASNL